VITPTAAPARVRGTAPIEDRTCGDNPTRQRASGVDIYRPLVGDDRQKVIVHLMNRRVISVAEPNRDDVL
jgi:hypothetical protein